MKSRSHLAAEAIDNCIFHTIDISNTQNLPAEFTARPYPGNTSSSL